MSAVHSVLIWKQFKRGVVRSLRKAPVYLNRLSKIFLRSYGAGHMVSLASGASSSSSPPSPSTR